MYSLVSTEPVTTSLPDTGASDATAAPFAWCETHKAPTHRRGLALIVGKLHPPIKRRQRDTKGIRTSDRPGSTGLSCATLGGHTTPPSLTAHYSRLDGGGGFEVQEVSDDAAPDYEFTLRYAPWVHFDVFPVATIEEAFPVIQRVYG